MILSPLLFLGLLAACALAVDVGSIAVEKSRMQNGADAASLAAVQVLTEQRRDGSSEADARAAAIAAAQELLLDNAPGARLQIQFGVVGAGGAFTSVDAGTTATAAKVDGARDHAAPGGPLSLIFAPIVGVDYCNGRARAVAETSGQVTAVARGLAPFAVPEDCIPPIGQEFGFYPSSSNGKGKGGGQTEPGNWGLLDLNGGSNGTPDLVNWIENGYPGSVAIDPTVHYTWIEGNPGWHASLEGALQAKIGQPLMVCVYDKVIGNGANAAYRCIGFLRIILTYADLTGKHAEVRGRVAGLVSLDGIAVGSSGWQSPNMRKTQLIQ